MRYLKYFEGFTNDELNLDKVEKFDLMYDIDLNIKIKELYG